MSFTADTWGEDKMASRCEPLLKKWEGGYGGVPPFDLIKAGDFKPAIEKAISLNRQEIEAITQNPETPTFENTIVALEQSGQTLQRVMAVYGVWSGGLSTPEFQKIESEVEPLLAAFNDEVIQNAQLFARIESVYSRSKKEKNLAAEEQRLLWVYHTRFVLNGARLNEAQKKRVAEINQRLAALSTEFGQNVLADEEDDFLVIEKPEDLEGLPPFLIDAAVTEAEQKNLKGQWVISNTRSSMEPFLTYAAHRELREKAFRKWTSRGDNNNENNNNQIVAEMLKLRAERSKLLGFETYAHWHLEDTMAKKPDAATDLMMKVWAPAVQQVRRDVVEMQAIVDAEGGGFKIQPWDYRYYAEKVRQAKYDLDFDLVKPYLQLNNIREAMFFVAQKIYGLTFTKIDDVPVFHEDVTVYKVTDRRGELVGLWYFDPYARPGKRSGAWMSSYRDQHQMGGEKVRALVSNNSNFIKGRAGEPVLISWDDANTMFHEFGHALHGLNSNVTYPSLSGTNTTRDFVEFPSQFHEHYLSTPEVLRFLKNSRGESLPKELIQKIERAKNFHQGFATVEFLASGIVDMKLHLAGDVKIDPREFEKATLAEIGMPSEIVMRHRIPQFGHIFAGGYAAGYYGYLWAEVLNHDAYEAFTEAGGPYDPVVAQKFYEEIMSVGNTVDPAEAYFRFRGREPRVEALLRARGF